MLDRAKHRLSLVLRPNYPLSKVLYIYSAFLPAIAIQFNDQFRQKNCRTKQHVARSDSPAGTDGAVLEKRVSTIGA
jgi:hypothetical protein